MSGIIALHATPDDARQLVLSAIECLEKFEREHPAVARFARELHCAQLHLWTAALILTLDDERGTN